MIETVILMVWLSSGEVQIFDAKTLSACEAERAYIETLAADEHICPLALAAKCVEGTVQR